MKTNGRHARAAVPIACVLLVAACSGSDTAQISVDGSNPDTRATQVDTTSQEPVPAETQPPTTVTETPTPRYETDDAEVLFDQNVVRTFEIDLPDGSLAELDADPAAEEYVEGSLTFDGETIEPDRRSLQRVRSAPSWAAPKGPTHLSRPGQRHAQNCRSN